MSTQTPMSPRERYIMKRRQRETVIFTWTGAVLAVLLLVGSLIGFGIVPFPFFTSFARGEKVAQAGDVPCPIGDGQAMEPQKVEVAVLNGTSKAGLANDVGDSLADLGFKIASRGNAAQGDFDGGVRVTSGPVGVNGAYTVAAAFPDAEIVLDSRLEADVTVTLGSGYDVMTKPEDFRKQLDHGLKPRNGCLTVSLN
ncbi:MAG: LytR C-terminal domain-containing protein [Actinomycetaceae bacterium]|nr:LytR C-terminal domain-containing protein [Actinomycetaceae bacterium]